jgi:hypothetical protein
VELEAEDPETCLLCGEPVERGPLHVLVHGQGPVCWDCARKRDPDDWGLDQFESILARTAEARDGELGPG